MSNIDAPSRTRREADSEPSQTSVDQASLLIRQAIITGQYGPGERIKLSDLTERFGLSAMPMREALRKLEGEGLVQIEANRGATVRRVDRKFLEDLYEVRAQLEILAVGRCIERMTVDKLETIDTLRFAHERAAQAGDMRQIVDANRTLHMHPFDIAGNLEARRLFQLGWELIHALRMRFGYRPNRLDVIVREHKMLMEAFTRLDRGAAEAVVRMHTYAGLEDILQALDLDRRADGSASRVS